VASLSQGRTAAAQCGLFTHKSVPVIFEPPCITIVNQYVKHEGNKQRYSCSYININSLSGTVFVKIL